MEAPERIARRVVELVAHEHPVGLVDAAELARRLGIQRSWVYAHAAELGAVRLGRGTRARLRFDPRVAMELMRPAERRERPQRPARRRPATGANARLLPIHREGAN